MGHSNNSTTFSILGYIIDDSHRTSSRERKHQLAHPKTLQEVRRIVRAHKDWDGWIGVSTIVKRTGSSKVQVVSDMIT